MNKLAPYMGLFAMAAIPFAVQAKNNTHALEEVVVTAQKRTQSSQDVPISVAAFSAEQLGNLGSTGLQELVQHVAGAELFDDRGSGQPTWVIRGVGLSDFNPNNTPTAAIYYDDFYLFSNALGGVGLFDIEQVEILKGPQGGLYGRNTSGGAVRVMSRRAEPGEASGGYVKASYGRWGKSKLEAAVGGSFNERTAYRLSAVTNQGGGWQDSLATPGNDHHGDQDFGAVRAQFALQLNDRALLQLKLDAGRDQSETTLALGRASLTADGSDRCASASNGSFADINCYTLANVISAAVPGQGPGPLASEQPVDGSRSTSSPINRLDNDWFGANIRFEWQADDFTLTSITGLLNYDFGQQYDFDASPLTFFHEDSQTELNSWSQEFRLQGEAGEDLFWLAGISYAEDTVDAFRNGDLNQHPGFPSGGFRAFKQQTQSWASYIQMEYQLAEKWRLSGSLRYTDEDKSLRNYRFYEAESGGIDLDGSGTIEPFFWLNNIDDDYELDAKFSGHIGLDWMPSEDMLIYAKATRGFKSGGFYGGFAFDAEELSPYHEEVIWAYELGLKSEFMDSSLRLNAAAYFYDYRDVQGFTQESSAITNTVLTKLGNLGDAEHKGAELEVVWLPESLQGLQLSAQFAYTDAEISDSNTIGLDPDGVGGVIQGSQRSFSPKRSLGLQISYHTELGDSLLLNLDATYSWRSDVNPRAVYRTNLDYSLFGIDSYQLLGLRLGLVDADENWQLALLGNNLSNEAYVVNTSADDLGSFNRIPGQPRSWTLELSYNW